EPRPRSGGTCSKEVIMLSKNPATGEELARFDELSPHELETKLERARAAFARHRRKSFAERGAAMTRAAAILERDKQRVGALMTQEMGKTLKSAIAEAEKCASACRYYAEHAERHLADDAVATDAAKSYTH